MGEARRRKLLGLYPDTAKPAPLKNPMSVITPPPTKRYLACALCNKQGGTLAHGPQGLVHTPDCEYAALQRKVQEDRARRDEERRRTWMRRARRLLPDSWVDAVSKKVPGTDDEKAE
jgi:hypothetical protein